MGFGAFYLLHLVFGLVDVSTIMGGFCCIGILVGITMAQSGLFVWAALSLAIFAVFNVLLVRAIFAWIDRWLAQRRTREIVSAVFLVAMLSMNFFNPAFRGKPGRAHGLTAKSRTRLFAICIVANQVQRLAAARTGRAMA